MFVIIYKIERDRSSSSVFFCADIVLVSHFTEVCADDVLELEHFRDVREKRLKIHDLTGVFSFCEATHATRSNPNKYVLIEHARHTRKVVFWPAKHFVKCFSLYLFVLFIIYVNENPKGWKVQHNILILQN